MGGKDRPPIFHQNARYADMTKSRNEKRELILVAALLSMLFLTRFI